MLAEFLKGLPKVSRADGLQTAFVMEASIRSVHPTLSTEEAPSCGTVEDDKFKGLEKTGLGTHVNPI